MDFFCFTAYMHAQKFIEIDKTRVRFDATIALVDTSRNYNSPPKYYSICPQTKAYRSALQRDYQGKVTID